MSELTSLFSPVNVVCSSSAFIVSAAELSRCWTGKQRRVRLNRLRERHHSVSFFVSCIWHDAACSVRIDVKIVVSVTDSIAVLYALLYDNHTYAARSHTHTHTSSPFMEFSFEQPEKNKPPVSLSAYFMCFRCKRDRDSWLNSRWAISTWWFSFSPLSFSVRFYMLKSLPINFFLYFFFLSFLQPQLHRFTRLHLIDLSEIVPILLRLRKKKKSESPIYPYFLKVLPSSRESKKQNKNILKLMFHFVIFVRGRLYAELLTTIKNECTRNELLRGG